MTTERFVNIKEPKRGTGRRCMHCNRRATITAVRVIRWEAGMRSRLDVHYCAEHAALRIHQKGA